MKKRSILVFIGFLAILLIAWFFVRRRWTEPASETSVGKTEALSSAKDTGSTSTSEASKAEGRRDEKSLEQYAERARQEGQKLNRPANFYGFVVDQHGKPVPNVEVEGGLSYFGQVVRPGLVPSYDKIQQKTDPAGRFSIEGGSGLALDVSLKDTPGYEFRPAKVSVSFRDVGLNQPAPTMSSLDHPYVFHAFVRGPGEKLSHSSFTSYDLVPDGREYTIMLDQKKIVPGLSTGDFTISIERPPGRMGQSDYDWSMRLKSVRSEMAESQDVFMYEAPGAGYSTAWSIAMHPGDPGYARTATRKFFIRTKSDSGLTYG
jgi:hypothetical protein